MDTLKFNRATFNMLKQGVEALGKLATELERLNDQLDDGAVEITIQTEDSE